MSTKGYTGPNWNWGDPTIKVGEKTEEQILLEKYPSKYQTPFSVFVREKWNEGLSGRLISIELKKAIEMGKVVWNQSMEHKYIWIRVKKEITRQKKVSRMRKEKLEQVL